MKYYVLARRKVKLISWDLTFISMLSTAGTVTRKTDSGITSKKRQIDCF